MSKLYDYDIKIEVTSVDYSIIVEIAYINGHFTFFILYACKQVLRQTMET